MIYVNIQGEVNHEMLDKFIKLHENSEDKEIVCFFETNWWDTSIWESIVQVINQIPNFTLVAQNEIASCGFDIFFFAKCKKKVNDICRWMTHLWEFGTSINQNHKKRLTGRQKALIMDMKDVEKKTIRFYKKIWMAKADIKNYKMDWDVNFSSRQLKMFVKNQKKIGYIK